MESDVTIGQVLGATIVATELSYVLCASGSEPIDVPQEVIQDSSASIDDSHDCAIGAEDVVNNLPGLVVDSRGNLC